MQIAGIQKTSLLDYPKKISAIIFTKGCNFHCGYCHNPELIKSSKEQIYNMSAFWDFLKSRQGKLDGIVITGGEPCLQDDIEEFIKKIKKLNFLVKLDTNGYFPEKLKKLIPNIDYIAMDIKAPLEKYNQITQVNIIKEKIQESINIIKNSSIDYEFRTTVIKSQLTFEDFEKIGLLINGAKKYYLQKFIPSKILDQSLINETSYTDEEFNKIIKILQPYITEINLR